jgi:hypothetical protein
VDQRAAAARAAASICLRSASYRILGDAFSFHQLGLGRISISVRTTPVFEVTTAEFRRDHTTLAVKVFDATSNPAAGARWGIWDG